MKIAKEILPSDDFHALELCLGGSLHLWHFAEGAGWRCQAQICWSLPAAPPTPLSSDTSKATAPSFRYLLPCELWKKVPELKQSAVVTYWEMVRRSRKV